MPRTTTLECPGCPPLRALTFDVLGLIKIIEARGKEGEVPKVVEKWGEPDFSKSVLAASMVDRKSDPLLAVARKNGLVEVLNPLNGEIHAAISNISGTISPPPEDDALVGLHLFAKEKLDMEARSCTLLTCRTKGNAMMTTVKFSNSSADSASTGSSQTWNACSSGSILCSKVDASETYGLFGGKGVEVNIWDLDQCSKIWTAKSPPKNSLGIFTPTWFTSATFLSKDDHRKFVAGTHNHQVRLYDISAQRRPVISFDFRETPIKSIVEDLDGNTIFVGNGSGDLASFDIRTGKLLGCFLGKCSGSIRSIARHPNFPVIASCGLDSYLRIWDIKTRQLLSSVFLKQHLSSIVFDSNFVDEVMISTKDSTQPESHPLNQSSEVEEEDLPVKRKKSSKQSKRRKSKSDQNEHPPLNQSSEDEEEDLPVKRKKSSKESKRLKSKSDKNDQRKKLKSKEASKSLESDDLDVAS